MNRLEHDFSYYVDRFKNNKPFTFARYGDGEWNAMFGKAGQNCDGHKYFPKMGLELIKSLQGYKYDNYIMGIQNLAIRQREKEIEQMLVERNFTDIQWCDSDVMHRGSRSGNLKPLVNAMKDKNIVIVGPKYLKDLDIFKVHYFVEVPKVDCYMKKDDIKKELINFNKYYIYHNHTPAIYSFSASMMAEILLYELYPACSRHFMIDFGSLWDVFVGHNTRTYHKNMSKETIKNNA